MLTSEPPSPVARGEDCSNACSHGCGDRRRQGLVCGAQRAKLITASPTAGDDVWVQANSRVEPSDCVHEADLHRHKVNVWRNRENIRGLSGTMPHLLIQRVARRGTKHHRGGVIPSTEEVWMLKPSRIAHRHGDAFPRDTRTMGAIGVIS